MNVKKQNYSNSGKRMFTLIELMLVIALIAILLAMAASSLRRAKQYALEVQCMNHIRQIAIGYNNYMNDYKTDSPMPPSGRFLDDMSIVYPYVKDIDVYCCPCTKTRRPASPDDLEIKISPSGNQFVATNACKDYVAAIYDEWGRQIYRGSQVNQGHGTRSYGINPDNPSGNFVLSSAEKGVIYENKSDNHFSGYRNVIYVKDLHYVKCKKVSIDSEEYVWFLTIKDNGRVDIAEVVKHNKGKK